MIPRPLGATARRSLAATALGAACVLTLGACSSSPSSSSSSSSGDKEGSAAATGRPELKVSGAYVPQPPTDKMAGGFLTVRNSGGKADKLTSVSSDVAGEVEMHETVEQQMRQVESLPVPAHGTLKLARGGNHLMLMELKHKPVKGQTVTFVLHFAKSGSVTVKAPVEATNYTPEK
ncbi:copper chaperone PCu(A)C [Streptomyces diacarni]|uniref:Copper chaperone PCu(A)C n=1 Tax=Streptomyces diacarni TaxID=2800381 RepID=A0A367E7A6_9ACTN|nr:copper chaperone PCu(A)C [Streptomyces diacarni]RCG13938.1 copper chaperone PCu(A)C [Streptomyces diacarni]